MAETMYEFVCDRIIPGCTHTETAETQEKAREKAEKHLRDHHQRDELNHQAINIDMAIVGIHR